MCEEIDLGNFRFRFWCLPTNSQSLTTFEFLQMVTKLSQFALRSNDFQWCRVRKSEEIGKLFRKGMSSVPQKQWSELETSPIWGPSTSLWALSAVQHQFAAKISYFRRSTNLILLSFLLQFFVLWVLCTRSTGKVTTAVEREKRGILNMTQSGVPSFDLGNWRKQ